MRRFLLLCAAVFVLSPGARADAELSILHYASSLVGLVGRDLVYKIVISNHSVVAARDVVVTGTIPAGASYVWSSPCLLYTSDAADEL